MSHPRGFANKRARGNDGKINPNTLRPTDVGTQVFKAELDGFALRALGGVTGGVLPPMPASALRVEYGHPLFTKIGDGSAIPKVLSAVNGLDAPFADKWPNDVAMQRMALKSTLRVLGVAAQSVVASDNDPTPGIGVKYMGLHNSMVESARAGARLVWDLRDYKANPQENNAAVHTDDTVNQYGFVLKTHSEETIGKQFAKACAELITQPKVWEQAMLGHYGNAKPLLSAVRADYRHCNTALVLGLELLFKAGIIRLNNGPATDAPAALPAQSAGLEQVDGGTPLSSAEVAARIAQFMGLTAPSNPLPLDAGQTKIWAELKHQFAGSLYYGSAALATGELNAAHEFGASYSLATGAQSIGRYPNGALKDDRIGSVVKLQINHTTNAVAGFANAVAEDEKNVAGTALTTADNGPATFMMHQ